MTSHRFPIWSAGGLSLVEEHHPGSRILTNQDRRGAHDAVAPLAQHSSAKSTTSATLTAATTHTTITTTTNRLPTVPPYEYRLLDVRLAEQQVLSTLRSQPRAVFTRCPGLRRPPHPNTGEPREPATGPGDTNTIRSDAKTIRDIILRIIRAQATPRSDSETAQ